MAFRRRLFALANEPQSFVNFPGAGHADFPLHKMVPAVGDFLGHVTGVPPFS